MTRVADPLVGGLLRNDSGRHGGCRLRVGPDGARWITTGDGAFSGTPQDLSALGGKVLRVNRFTGAGASGNPFTGSGDPDVRRVFTSGHRNVQGIAFRPGSDEPWAVEHGPTRDDEVNRLVPGGNYGWDPGPGYDESVPMTDTAKFPDAVPARWSSGFPTIATSGADFLRVVPS
ncbi:MAG: PQQ-dependent sugar dehydrogenase [Acidimicrobiales bacterium]|nr:PQQ-dependent sugar dehydrogenase [Acidimicrobiales bacterium]